MWSGHLQRPTFLSYVGGMWFSLFVCSSASTGYMYTANLVLHEQIYDDPPAKIELKIGPTVLIGSACVLNFLMKYYRGSLIRALNY